MRDAHRDTKSGRIADLTPATFRCTRLDVRQVSPRVKVHARLLLRPTVKHRLGVYSRADGELSPVAQAFRRHLEAFVSQGHGIPAAMASNKS
jgi:hypothetical protein